MNSNAKICLFVLGMLTTWTSCKPVETEPRDWILDDLVWDAGDKNATIAAWVLNDVYSYVPSGFNRIGATNGTGDYLDAASGDAIPSRPNAAIENYTNGRVSLNNNPDPYWGASYAGIRRANIFLRNIDRVPGKAEVIKYWKSEARFLRALFYFELLKRYGGVPLIGDTLFRPSDNLQIPRNTFEQTLNYIVSECDAIKDSMRLETDAAAYPDNEWGRAAKGAALALKVRAYLYGASPLFNGGGLETSPERKALTGYPSYDATRWQKVVDAVAELKALNYYTLTGVTFQQTFTTKKNKDVIFAKQSGNNTQIETNNAPMGYAAPTASNGWTSPTQDLVDAFPMNNGLAITEAGSGYSAANPYANRDPRLNLTIFYNGQRWLSRIIETFEGGRDKPGGIAVQTRTGYYARKFMADFTNNTTYTNQSHNFALFRYAEVLLANAEALNELGRTEDAVAEVITVRRRAGIAAGANNRFGIRAAGAATQDYVRELIRNERRIELAFEEHRFWDLRRWKLAGQVLNGPVYGMKITKQANGTFTYEKFVANTLRFSDRLYHLPIPYDETARNLALIQNEGW